MTNHKLVPELQREPWINQNTDEPRTRVIFMILSIAFTMNYYQNWKLLSKKLFYRIFYVNLNNFCKIIKFNI